MITVTHFEAGKRMKSASSLLNVAGYVAQWEILGDVLTGMNFVAVM